MVQAVVLLVILNCWLGQEVLSSVALEEPTDINTVFVPVNGTAKLQWSLFIGENAGRSSVNVMIKKNNSLLCQWVKAHWEVNQCDPGMNLTISPKQVHVPGPTNIIATFSFRNKRRVDDGTYECRFVIDEKWDEIQILQIQLETTADPNGTMIPTYNDSSNTTITCFVSCGQPKPDETILLLNGTEISRSDLTCQKCTYGRDNSKCSSIHSVEKSTGIYKCRLEVGKNVVNSAEVDIPFTAEDTLFCSSMASERPTTVFARENRTTELKWSLFIGENAGRSSVNVMIKKRDALLCQWVKAHWEVNQCDPGMKLTISPEQVRVPGPTNITATFFFKNKGRSDDGIYECRFVVDEKWHEMQVYPKYLVTTVRPTFCDLNATNSNTCITDIICHVRGGRPKPIETILIKNGTEVSRSRLKCQKQTVDTDDNGVSYCSSVHYVENSGGWCKCRVKHANYIVDSTEMDISFRTKERETSAVCPVMYDSGRTACIAVCVVTPLTTAIVTALVVVWWERRKHVKRYDRAANVTRSEGETEQFKLAPDIEENDPSIPSSI